MPKITQDELTEFEELCSRCNGNGSRPEDSYQEKFYGDVITIKCCKQCNGVGALLTSAGNNLIDLILRHTTTGSFKLRLRKRNST